MSEQAKHTPSLAERVVQFSLMELPGQPRMMHMGTSYLVNDLWRSHQELLAALKAAHPWIETSAEGEEATKIVLAAIAKAEGRS